ncbi:ABC transporter permease [Variovorax sp.]|jgi:NitT/TauT family transport system permease protein|uniref:ABC transporter permease n=1 Tax=Variovorax sp. TaxID=1871043 RepID=UPI0037DA66F9
MNTRTASTVLPAAPSAPAARRIARPEIPLAIALLVVVVGGWELAVRALDVSALVVPPPSAVALALWSGLISNAFTYHFGVTAYETLAGFAVGAGLGLVLGSLVSQFVLVEKTLYPYIVAFQTIPKVAIAPLFVIWFGYGMTSKVIITATIAFFPALANTIVGLRAAPADQIELLRAFTATRWQIFRMARVPHALPYVFAGLDVSIVLSVIGAVVGEFVGAQAGLGYLILQRTFSMDTAGMFAILILLSAMGIVLHAVMKYARKRVVFWLETQKDATLGA